VTTDKGELLVKQRKLMVAGALCVAGTLALTACGGSSGGGSGGASNTGSEGTPQRGGTLNMLGVGDVDYMDPNISYYSIGYLGLRPWSRQLYTYPADPENATKPFPDLATGPAEVSADGLSVTIKIRPGAQWDTSPARQVSAEDVVRGAKSTCNPAQPFGGLPDYQDLIVGFQTFCDGFAKVKPSAAAIAGYMNSNKLAGVSVGSDPQTVVFKLTHAASYFTAMLTLPAFSPRPKEYDKYVPASADLAQHTISDGPYKVTAYSATKNITFERNPAWTAATDPVRKAYVDKIVVNETVSQESAQQQLQTGTASADMEFDNFPPVSQLPALIAAKDPLLNLGETDSSNPFIIFNQRSPNNNKAMAKVPFRQALEHAINRTSLIQDRGGPTQNPPLTQVLPKGIVGGEQTTNMYPFDQAKAKQLMQQAGVTNPTLKVLYNSNSEGTKKNFATLQQNLTEVGIKVVGVPAPQADLYTKFLQVPSVASRGAWDLVFAGWGPDWYGNAALSYFKPLYSGAAAFPPIGSNYGFYDSSVTNDLIAKAQSAKSESEAGTLWHQADMQVMKDAIFFPITSPLQANYHAKQVHNAVYLPSLQNFDPANVWLDPKVNG
jgi:peptide/nickel transport system substrate-binding protein